MLTDPNLKSKVDLLWDKLWTGGLSNPMDAIEQFSFLLFLKRLDEAEDLTHIPHPDLAHREITEIRKETEPKKSHISEKIHC